MPPASVPLYTVDSDGKTVWVNGRDGLLGRFGVNGIDIHHPLTAQVELGSECLFCTHAPTTAEDWDLFVGKMFSEFGIVVLKEHRPDRFRSC